MGDMSAEGDADVGDVRVEGGCGEDRVWTEMFTTLENEPNDFREQ
jgi:hypothetical protein